MKDLRELVRRFPLRTLIAALVAIAAGGTLAIVVDEDGPDGPKPPRTISVSVDTNGNGVPDETLKVPEPAVDAVEKSDLGQHDKLRNEEPPTATDSQLEANDAAEQRNRQNTKALPTAGASAGFPGCKTAFIGSASSRGGVRPSLYIEHYTVSGNRPGWGDVDAIIAFFARRSTGASSHFIIDREGHCAYIVPIELKAWTAAAMNSFGIQFEFINSGSELSLLDAAGYAKARLVHQEIRRRTGIPLRRGSVSNCVPTRSGIIQHADGGACAGGHHDIGPFSLPLLIKQVAGAPQSVLTKRSLTIARRAARSSGARKARACRMNVNQRRALRKAGFSSKKGRRLKRGPRYQRLERNHKRHCR